MWKKSSKGFIWVETLVGLAVFMTLATIVVPIYTSVQTEKVILRDRSIISLYFYNELQQTIYDKHIEKNRTIHETIHNRHVTIRFNEENEYLKGCVSWNNAKERLEKFCLYGFIH